MSEQAVTPISALDHAEYRGLVQVRDCGPQGMITLRGDLGSKPVKAAVNAATGAIVPEPLTITSGAAGSAAWMSPDELLLLCPYAAAEGTLAAAQDKLGDAHALAVNVSDARALIELSGPDAREVLAKLCPLDLSPAGFDTGTIRRTRMAQVPAAIWLTDTGSFRVICFRSVADHTFELLKTAAHPGAGVGYF